MAALITRTRLRIGDTAGGSQVFDDDQVQDALDAHKVFVRYEELRAEPTFTATATLYKDFFSSYSDWEADAALVSYSWAALTPETSDYLTGHWSFNAAQNLGVRVSGQTYDTAAAAVQLAREWLAKLKLEYTFSTAGDSFNRDEKITHLETLIRQLLPECRAVVVSAERFDTGG